MKDKDGKTAVDIAKEKEQYKFLWLVASKVENTDDMIQYGTKQLTQDPKDIEIMVALAGAYSVKAKNAADLEKQIEFAEESKKLYQMAADIDSTANVSGYIAVDTLYQELITKKEHLEEEAIKTEEAHLAEEAKKAEQARKSQEMVEQAQWQEEMTRQQQEQAETQQTAIDKKGNELHIGDTVKIFSLFNYFVADITAIDSGSIEVYVYDVRDLYGISEIGRGSQRDIDLSAIMVGVNLFSTSWIDPSLSIKDH